MSHTNNEAVNNGIQVEIKKSKDGKEGQVDDVENLGSVLSLRRPAKEGILALQPS